MKKQTIRVWYMPELYVDPNAGTTRPDFVTADYPPQGEYVEAEAEPREYGLAVRVSGPEDEEGVTRVVIIPWHRIVSAELLTSLPKFERPVFVS